MIADWVDKEKGLAFVQFLKADDVEAEVLSGQRNLRAAAKAISCHGPKEVVITHAKGVLVYAEGKFFSAPFHPKSLRGGRAEVILAFQSI